jgi:non-canonical (house-cleaning) NTP pyrophosphatase
MDIFCYLGSESDHKLRALRAALDAYDLGWRLMAYGVTSGVPEQPLGRTAIVQGARNRALNALAYAEPEQRAFGVGMENGLYYDRLTKTAYDVAYVCLVRSSDSAQFGAWSAAVPVPRQHYRAVVSGDIGHLKRTLGTDVTKVFTRDRLHRSEVLSQALACALAQPAWELQETWKVY